MSTSTKVMLAIVAAVTVLSIIGVIFGVMTHTEPGLMKVCWSDTDTAVYDCDGGDDLTWSRRSIPFSVETDGYVGEVQTSIDLINTQVGCDLLKYHETLESQPADISIASDGVMSRWDKRGGITWHLRDGNRLRARIELYAAGSMAQRIIVHELGHALGLAHDPFMASIMYKTQRDSSGRLENVRFTDSDRSLLHSLYCN